MNYLPGVATQNKNLFQGPVIQDKYRRVINFHRETIHSASEILAASGPNHFELLHREHTWRRIGPLEVKNYQQLCPYEN